MPVSDERLVRIVGHADLFGKTLERYLNSIAGEGTKVRYAMAIWPDKPEDWATYVSNQLDRVDVVRMFRAMADQIEANIDG